MIRVLKRINYFWTNRFVRKTVIFQIGFMFGNIFQALAGVFMARILQPEGYGIFVLAITLASLLSIILASGTQDATASLLSASYARGDQSEINEILSFYLKITIWMILFTSLAVVVAPYITGHLYDNQAIGWYAAVVVLASIFSSTLFSLTFITLQVFGEISKMMFLSTADQVLRWSLSLLLVYKGYGLSGAVAGQLIGAVIIFFSTLIIWKNIKKKHTLIPSIGNLFGMMKNVSLKKYLGFSFWIALDRNLSSLYLILPVLLAGVYISAHEVAYFKLAFGYLNLSLSALGPISVLLNVEFPKMRVDNRTQLARNFVRVSWYSVGLSTAITAIILAIAPIVFRILYGESYLPSLPYIYGLIVFGAFFGIGVGLGPMWRAINRVKTSILINLLILGFGIPGAMILIQQWGLWGAVVAVTIWFTASHFISFFYLANFLRNKGDDL